MQYTSILYDYDTCSLEDVKNMCGHTISSSDPDLHILVRADDKQSIGIEDVHTFLQELSLKPFGGTQTIAVIQEAHRLTIPAQQSLLKTIEEPGENTQLILATSKPAVLLSTIRSRCVEILTHSKEAQIPSSSLYEKLVHASISTCIQLASEQGSSKEDAINACTQLLLHIRELIPMATEKLHLIKKEKECIKAIEQLRNNVNSKLVLEHLFFNIANHRQNQL
ncbi:hypothetical protein C5B42_04825 [Candidatus Cerribacteria bacterium 'Amazon FNV 2010 28 9']|uniref:DNA polymerase III subunit delta n=1 Tax=Candidatus Cerribacteria bacterium 'Amazon FNV 2010 28 9' TaxID=2081795 RepID=A0A317JMK1_9BACT|nr:MAG: hypothetical protein C5B42_04825 [Candidatus Cerribacteria bacterium 'Amazon FNV 2010 28 9']